MLLYKYRDFTEKSKARTLEILNKQELFFASIKSFNDPFDGKVFLDFKGKLNEIKAAQIRTQYTMNLKKEEKLEGITIEQVKKLIQDKFTEEYICCPQEHERISTRIQELHNNKGVLSLSLKNDNILMWSHYTFNHQGVCFGFKFTEQQFSCIRKMRYQTHYEDIWGWLHTDDEIVNRILFSKAIDWQYEDEYRIIRDTIGVEKFQTESLKEIIFGSMMNQEDKKEIIEECKRCGLSPKFREAVLDVESYKINIIDYIEG